MLYFLFLVTLFFSIALCHDHPMVGVISYPGSPSAKDSTSYIQVETAKFIESTGARNVGIRFDQDWPTSVKILQSLNGIYIQNSFNGEKSQNPIFKETLKNAYEYSSDKNAQGITFPIWTSGITALQLSEVLSSTQDMAKFTEKIDALDYATTLNIIEFLTPNEKVQITNMRTNFLKPATMENIVYFNQDRGMTVESFKNDKFLSSNFDVVATATDRQGKEFIAILKGKEVPVVLSFALFEAVYNFYPKTAVPHSSEATRLAVQFSKSFTNMCRANDQTYGSVEKEYENNLYNRKLTTTIDPEYQTFYF